MPTATRAETAHRRTTEATATDIAAFLTESLGRALTAYIADVDPKTVDRWVRGDAPRTDTEQRLRVAYQVFQLLQEEDSPHTARAWFIGLNPQLDDTAPAQALHDGHIREVLVAARSFALGG